MRFSKHIFLYILLLISSPLFGQEDKLPFFQFTSDDGLPSMHVYDLIQDKKGFIWMGTDAGLCRFDGYEFKHYTTADGLANNDIVRLYEDSKGRIWLGSIGDLCYVENNEFHIIKSPNDNIRQFYGAEFGETVNNSILVSSKSVLWYLDSLLRPELITALPKTGTKDLLFSYNDTIYIYHKKSILLFVGKQPVDTIQLNFPIDRAETFSAKRINQTLYFTSPNGLGKLDLPSKKQEIVLPGNFKSTRLTAIPPNNLWLTSLNNGLIHIQTPTEFRSDYSYSVLLKDKVPGGSLVDNEGNLWISTLGNGVYMLPAKADLFNNLSVADGLVDSKIESVFIDEDSVVYVGFQNGVYNTIKNNQIEKITIKNKRQYNRILCFAEARKHQTLFIGSDVGVFMIKKGISKRIINHATKNIYFNDNIFTFCTSSGVYSFSFTTADSLYDQAKRPLKELQHLNSVVKRINSKRSYAYLKSKDGTDWIGEVNNLKSKKDGTTKSWSEVSNLFKIFIKDIKEAPDGSIWVATYGAGIIVIKNNDFFNISKENGLSSNICRQLQIDPSGVWVATNRGLCQIKYKSFADKNPQINIYNSSNGLISNEVMSFNKKGPLMIIGTNKGIVQTDVSQLTTQSSPPKIYISKVTINGADSTGNHFYYLKNNLNDIQIKYVGISYSSLKALTYQYRMIGLDDEWRTTQTLEKNFSDLPPGDYQFEVRAFSSNSVESLEPAFVHFCIQEHFTDTRWFRGLFLFAIAGLIFYLYNTTLTYAEKNKLSTLVEQQTEELNSKVKELADSNARLERSNESLQEFAYIASHDLKEPLRTVASFIQLLKLRNEDNFDKESKEYMEFAVGGVKRMENIIQDILAYSKVDKNNTQKTNINLTSILNEVMGNLKGRLEEKKGRIILKNPLPIVQLNSTNALQLFQNLISNGIKYNKSSQPQVEIDVHDRGHFWEFSFADNGIGIDEDYKEKIFGMFQRLHSRDEYSGTGIGLAICKKIVESNGGKIRFKSSIGQGTTFYFTLPKLEEE